MCGGRPTPPPPPQRIAVRPALRPAPKPRRVPQPEEIRKEREDPNIITGKKKTPQELLKVKEGVKQFDAIDPGMNVDTPTQGIPNPKA